MDFCNLDRTVRKPNLADTLTFSPTTLPVELSEPRELTNPSPNRKCFNLGDGAEQFKVRPAWSQSFRCSSMAKIAAPMTSVWSPVESPDLVFSFVFLPIRNGIISATLEDISGGQDPAI